MGSGNEIVINQAPKPLSATDIQAQVNTIQHVMKQVMKQNVHYGVIPGCKEPSLYKPGAEKIMTTFRLSADPEVTDLSDDDAIRFRVKVRLMSPSGTFVGAGIGECSTGEEKYKWRKAVCPQEYEETPPERRREKWCKGWGNKPAYKLQQVRTEPADLANTVLKMAKKRGLVDAVLTATAASDCFTQDVEDLPPEYMDDEPHGQQPAQKSAPQQLPPYDQAKFAANLPKWGELVASGGKTPEAIIKHLKTVATLTDEQYDQIMNLGQGE